MKLVFFEEFGNAFVPRKIRPYIRKYMLKAGIIKVPYKLFGLVFYISLAITLIIYISLIYPVLTKPFFYLFDYKIYNTSLTLVIFTFLSWFLLQLILVTLSGLILWGYYSLLIYNRQKKIEKILPEFLQAVSVNLKAGMTFDKALWNAVQPEFGVLEKEIEIVAKKVMTGKDMEDALLEFNNKYKSNILKEAIDLIIVGLRSGGSITDLLDRLVANIRQSTNLKAEMVTAVTGNIIFITLIAIIISPVLFALSFNLLIIIQNLSAKLAIAGTSFMLPFRFGEVIIEPSDFILFSRLAVIVIATFSAIIITNISTGNIKSGIKYLPIYIGVASLLYEFSLKVLTIVFSTIL